MPLGARRGVAVEPPGRAYGRGVGRFGVTPQDPEELRARRIRMSTILAITWLVMGGVFALIGYTTDLNGFAGTMTGVTLALLFAIVAVVLKLKQPRRPKS